jgi:hypothetical protein
MFTLKKVETKTVGSATMIFSDAGEGADALTGYGNIDNC